MPVNHAAALLRSRLADDTPIICPGVQDGLSARINLAAGHKALYMTGAGTAIYQLGMPDLGLTTADDMVRNAAMIASLDRSVPVIADADTGFGGPVMVSRTVERYILAGVAGLHIEDQVVTKRCGHLMGKELVDEATFVARIMAADKARTRAIRRLKLAVEAGADVVFLEGMKSLEEMEKVTKVMAPTPCLLNMVNGGVTPLVDARRAGEMGFKIVIWPCLSMTAAYLAVSKAAQELRDTGMVGEKYDEDGKVKGGIRELFELCGLSECAAFDKEVGGKSYDSV